MEKFLKKITKSKLGKILDHLFLDFSLFLPKFALYLIIPTFVFSFMNLFGVKWVTDIFLIKMTLSILPFFILGCLWFIYRTTSLD